MRAVRLAVLFSLVAVLCFGGVVRAQEPARTGSIEGTVWVKDAPNAAVEVTAIEADSGRPYFTKTDDKGRFRFSGLPPGEFQVFAAAEGFCPVWETGGVSHEVTWQPELFLERVAGKACERGTVFLPTTGMEPFRKASAVCLGKVKSVDAQFGNSDHFYQVYDLTVVVEQTFRGKGVPAKFKVRKAILTGSPEPEPGEPMLLLFSTAKAGGKQECRYAIFFPRPEWRGELVASERMWNLLEMTRMNRLSRAELVEWLVRGIEDENSRMGMAEEALIILKRSREREISGIRNAGPGNPYDLAVEGEPLFSEEQRKRIGATMLGQEKLSEEDLEVLPLLIELKCPGLDALFLEHLEKRKNEWWLGTLKLLKFSAAEQNNPRGRWLVELYRRVEDGAFQIAEAEFEPDPYRTTEQVENRMRKIAEPQLLLILKSYLRTVEDSAKDAQ
jgi:hypothetical protein